MLVISYGAQSYKLLKALQVVSKEFFFIEGITIVFTKFFEFPKLF